MYKAVDSPSLHAMLGEEAPQLVDVRSAEEFACGAIPGARHIELAALPVRLGELDSVSPIVLYCLSGARSARACAFLAQRGFGRLYHLEGGVAAWARAGFPVTR